MQQDAAAHWDDEGHHAGHRQIVVASATGRYLTLESGQRLLDAASGHSCVNLGYGHEELIEAAARSTRTLAYCSPDHLCRPVIALAAKLSQLLGGDYRLRYAATGGGANELAIEIARRFWLHRGQPAKRKILALDRSYHGSTGAASFASGPGVLQSPQADRSAEFLHVPGPRDVVAGRSRDLATLRQNFEAQIAVAGAETIAAIIAEPVAFAGGVVVPPDGFLEMLAELGRRHNILLIIDEVITGFGRSGDFFAFQRAKGVRPDIVTMGKGITSAYYPLSAAAVSAPIYESFLAPGNEMNKVITMAGHPVGCDVALEVIRIMERDGLVERVRRNEAVHLSRLMALRDLPGLRDVRGRGHMWGLEFGGAGARSGADLARAIADRCFDAGLLVLQAEHQIRLNPPLTTTDEEMTFIVETLDSAVRAEAAAA